MAISINTAQQLSKLQFITELQHIKNELDSLRPLPKDIEDRVIQKFRLDWNYHSNAIEGNPLTYGETTAFIMEGITAKGKTLKDHLDIKGHDEAIKFILTLVKEHDYILTEADIRNLHQMILKEPFWVDAITVDGQSTKKEIKIGQYKSSSNHVKTPTGEIHYYSTPEQTPILMGELMQWFKEASLDSTIHPLVTATLFHHQFTAIHPFDDGNGRMARLLMNLILLQHSFPPIVIKQNDRNNYYQVLRQADAGEYIPITEYMSDLLKHSLEIYISAAKGESIEEDDDIDKEIKLFVKSKILDEKYEKGYSKENRDSILTNSIIPLIETLNNKIQLFNDLFITVNINISYSTNSNNESSIHLGIYDKQNLKGLNDTIDSFKKTDLKLLKFTSHLSGYKFLGEAFTLQVPIRIRFENFNYTIGKLKTFQNTNNTDTEKKLISKFYHQQLSKNEINEIAKTVVEEIKEIITSKTTGNAKEK